MSSHLAAHLVERLRSRRRPSGSAASAGPARGGPQCAGTGPCPDRYHAGSNRILSGGTCAAFVFTASTAGASGNPEHIFNFITGYLCSLPLILVAVVVAKLGWRWSAAAFLVAFLATGLPGLLPEYTFPGDTNLQVPQALPSAASVHDTPVDDITVKHYLQGFLPGIASTTLIVIGVLVYRRRARRSRSSI
jgi:hypothetical protein